jgi:sigma-B regulation protein RsbU (phosphoserine phosphatase)
MELEDGSQNPRIASLTKLMAALKQSRTPFETLRTIRQGFGEAYGSLASMMITTRGLADGEFRLVQLRREGDYGGDSDPWLQEQFPLYRGGLVATIIKSRVPHIVNDVDWADDPHFHTILAGYRSIMAVPFDGDRLPMTWALFLKRSAVNFTTLELEQAVLRTVMVGWLLESQTLAQELARANERIDKDIRQLADLQRTLLPNPLPEISGLEIAVSYEPSGQAGGDLYDFFPLNVDAGARGRWCIFIGDASGHGSAAAVVMAIVQTILHANPSEAAGPADMLMDANRQLCRKKIGGFVTAFLGIYEPDTRRLVYASAGHPPPLVKAAADGKVAQLDAVSSYPLGIDATNPLKSATIELHEGDTLLLYTDGITEARGADHAMFEFERLELEFREHSGRPGALIKYLRDLVNVHQRGQRPVDDQTLVAVRLLKMR